MTKAVRYLWAAPVTCVGLCFVPLAWSTGGRVQIDRGVIEVFGGILQLVLRRGIPFFGAGAAMTLGHVILARDAECLEKSRAHERVHVRQFERWGLFLLPAYVLASLWVRRQGFDPHLDNPFECEAYENASPTEPE